MSSASKSNQGEAKRMENEQKMTEKHQKECTQGEETEENNVNMEGSNENQDVQDNEVGNSDVSVRDNEGDNYLKLLMIKTYKLKDDEDPQEIESDTALYAAWLMSKWIKRGDIEGVKDVFKNETIKDLTNYNFWLSKPRRTGKRTIKVELYFSVATSKWLKEIIDKDRKVFKKDNIWIEPKRTEDEHTNKVGYITGPVVDKANMSHYDTMIKYFGQIEDGKVELKKK